VPQCDAALVAAPGIDNLSGRDGTVRVDPVAPPPTPYVVDGLASSSQSPYSFVGENFPLPHLNDVRDSSTVRQIADTLGISKSAVAGRSSMRPRDAVPGACRSTTKVCGGAWYAARCRASKKPQLSFRRKANLTGAE